MRSGSPAQDGGGWPSAQRPHSDEAMSNQGRYGSGPRSQANEGQGGRQRRAVRTRDLLALRLPAAGPRVPGSTGVGLWHRPGVPAAGHGRLRLRGSGLLRPVLRRSEDPLRQPGVSRRSGVWRPERPRNAAAPRPAGDPATGSPSAGVPGYHVPEVRNSSRPGYPDPGYQPQEFAPPSGGQEIWPVTGAQEALPDTGPQPVAAARGGLAQPGSAAYQDQWFDNPRLGHRDLDDVPAPPRRRLVARRATTRRAVGRYRSIRGSRA